MPISPKYKETERWSLKAIRSHLSHAIQPIALQYKALLYNDESSSIHHGYLICHPSSKPTLHDLSNLRSRELRAILGVLRLSECKWHVSIFDHVLNLSPHCFNVSASAFPESPFRGQCTYSSMRIKSTNIPPKPARTRVHRRPRTMCRQTQW